MRCIVSSNTNPCFNLASEEVLLRHRKENYFLLYINEPSIIVGKHQNTLAEINFSYARENGIKVVRRISGGGTVFHDPGNLNFAFVTNAMEGEQVNYERYTRPLIAALANMGLEVSLGKRNELVLNGMKISGTASHVYRKRVLHHGTLLFDSRMEDLANALKVKQGSFSDRAVKSVKSKVTNIREHLVDKMGIKDFREQILRHILDNMENAANYNYSRQDLEDIGHLAESKFSSWEWNFAYSPKYHFSKALKFSYGEISLNMNVDKGVIREVSIEGDFLGTKDIQGLEDFLVGTIHDPETIRKRLSGISVEDYISGMENEALLSGMF